MRLHGGQEADVVLSKAFEEDVVGLRELGIVEKISLGDGELKKEQAILVRKFFFHRHSFKYFSMEIKFVN